MQFNLLKNNRNNFRNLYLFKILSIPREFFLPRGSHLGENGKGCCFGKTAPISNRAGVLIAVKVSALSVTGKAWPMTAACLDGSMFWNTHLKI